jgi:Flp pilus assembly pilin Flp
MNQLITQLYRDEDGFVVSAELMLISTVGIIALVVGLSAVSNAVNNELRDVATAFSSVNQSFSFRGSGFNGNSQYMDPMSHGDQGLNHGAPTMVAAGG